MATYKGIQGYSVQTLASDPSPAASVEGQLWFNSTSSSYKISMAGVGAWSSGGAMNVTRAQDGLAGSQTAAVISGAVAPAADETLAETYNGTSWTAVNTLNSGRSLSMGAGTQTDALTISGHDGYLSYSVNVELYNGTSWVEQSGNVNSARAQGGGCGLVSTAALIFGGEGLPFPANNAKTESYNGSTWSEVNVLNTGRYQNTGAGSSVSALTGAGYSTAATNIVETWNGTSWTAVNAVNTTAEGRMGMGANNTTGTIMGGRVSTTYYTNTESYNGTGWTEVGDLATGRYNGSAVGTAGVGMLAGGSNPGTGGSTTTEEWTGAPVAVKTVTTS